MYGDSAGLPELQRAVPQRIGLTDHYGMRCQIGYGRRAYRRDRPGPTANVVPRAGSIAPFGPVTKRARGLVFGS